MLSAAEKEAADAAADAAAKAAAAAVDGLFQRNEGTAKQVSSGLSLST
jgi:hypothetical protein